MNPLQVILRALEVFRSHDEAMPVQRVVTFMYAALRNKVTREDVAEALGQSIASAYRNLMALSDQPYVINSRRKQGQGFLTFSPDPYETRRLVWTLTPKGRRLQRQLEEIAGGNG